MPTELLPSTIEAAIAALEEKLEGDTFMGGPTAGEIAAIRGAIANLRQLEQRAAPFPIEVQPPQHVLEAILLDMEGDYTLSSLRYVVYNDADRGEWLQPHSAGVPEPDVPKIDFDDLPAIKGGPGDWGGLKAGPYDPRTKREKPPKLDAQRPGAPGEGD